MLPPLKVSNDLLRRADDQRAQAAQAAEVDLSSAPPPPPEAIGALFSKTFGALDAALTMQELNCRTRGLGDHEIRTLLFVLRGGGGPLGTLGSTLPASSSCIGSLRKLDLSSNYMDHSDGSSLAEALRSEHCRLTDLDLSDNSLANPFPESTLQSGLMNRAWWDDNERNRAFDDLAGAVHASHCRLASLRLANMDAENGLGP